MISQLLHHACFRIIRDVQGEYIATCTSHFADWSTIMAVASRTDNMLNEMIKTINNIIIILHIMIVKCEVMIQDILLYSFNIVL